MKLEYTAEHQAFREEVRAWLKANVPAEPLQSFDTEAGFQQHREWEAKLYEGRWGMITWPEEMGGRGADLMQWLIFEEEYYAASAPLRVNQNGIFLLGPTLMEYGTEEQKKRFLNGMAPGKDIWCQGWSEPNAGSDMAAIRSRADLSEDGTHYVINGQKTWTTLAQYAALSETLLASGARLPDVIGMVRKLEAGSEMETDLAQIEQNFAEGHADYDSASKECRAIPDFFNWIVAQAGEEVASGFGHARIIYTSRAESKMQAFLYCFLPVNILLVGGLLLFFFLPFFDVFTDLINMMDNLGGS